MNLSSLKLQPAKPQNDLLERIETFLEARANKALPYKQKPGHKPSALGTDCLRRIYYSYYRVERDEPINAFLARIFDTGNYYEDMVMSWFVAMGEHIPYRNKGNGEIPIGPDGKPNPQFPISVPAWRVPKGYIDNAAIVDGKLWLYEIKSKNGDKYDALTEPDPEHWVQVATYFKAFTDHLQNGDYAHIAELKGFSAVAGVKVIYINKNNSLLKVYTLTPDELSGEAGKIEAKLDAVNAYIDRKELPPMTKGDCKYCDFKAKCKKNSNPVV